MLQQFQKQFQKITRLGEIMEKKKKNKKSVSRVQAKRLEKILINSADEVVVETLGENLDASNVDIKEVVKNMDDPENMVEVVRNNFDEIISQNNVRDTLKYLDDSDVAMILEENKEVLKRKRKMAFAIEAINDNNKKINMILKNLKSLSDIELERILSKLNADKPDEKEEIEKQKIRIIGKKIIEHIVHDGAVWHIRELTSSLDDESKKLLLDVCLRSMASYEKEKNKKINSNVKIKFAFDLLSATNLSYSMKDKIMAGHVSNGILSMDEKKEICEKISKSEIKKDQDTLSY